MIRTIVIVGGASLAFAAPAAAQLDPLLFLKDTQPYIIFAVDTSNRMQRDAPTDASTVAASLATSNYYDPFVYRRTLLNPPDWETVSLGVNAANTTATYRRIYKGLSFVGTGATTCAIEIITDTNAAVDVGGRPDCPTAPASYALFESTTRLALARAAMYQAIVMNHDDVRFGLVRMRQSAPRLTEAAFGGVRAASASQAGLTDDSSGGWKLGAFASGGPSTAADAASAVLVSADANDAADDHVQEVLGLDVRGVQRSAQDVAAYTPPSALLPAGVDTAVQYDAPLDNLLRDARAEAAAFLRDADPCTNAVVVLIAGGGEGSLSGLSDPTAALADTAATLLDVEGGHRVPVYVVAIAPPAPERAQLQMIASTSGGQYFEVTRPQIEAAAVSPTIYGSGRWPAAGTWAGTESPLEGTVIVPELVAAINTAIQHGLVRSDRLNPPPTPLLPFGAASEFQTTAPVVGTVDLDNARDITGAPLPASVITDRGHTIVPQRSNLLVTAGFDLPGFAGALRGFRQYAPVADSAQPSGYKFVAAATRLWVACAPGVLPAPSQAVLCAGLDSSRRNLYTAKPDGTIVPFAADPGSLAVLAPLMNLNAADAAAVIDAVRRMPFGAVIDSMPAIMSAPSLDPPPDIDYPAFAAANGRRRSLVWVGTNAGVLEAVDGRLGIEVWGFIPTNLLPKLKALRMGQGFSAFEYFVDGSPKLADVKYDGKWHTHVIVGEGAGGVAYQSFDVTLGDMASFVAPDSDDIDAVLAYFADPARITLNWSFPRYADFDPTLTVFDANTDWSFQYGDIGAAAPAVEKTVGQAWSSPAIGQVLDAGGPFAVFVGSGFLPHTTEQQGNRGGVAAGTTFYVLNAKDGVLLASADVGNDGTSEALDDCARSPAGDQSRSRGKRRRTFACSTLKNALQSDVTASGRAGSRFVTSAYAGDLDGTLWRFDMALDAHHTPQIDAKTGIYRHGADQPIAGSIAVAGADAATAYIFFATGSDLLPSSDRGTTYHLTGIFDHGSAATLAFDRPLANAASGGADEKATVSPALAGGVVFFTTTTTVPAAACAADIANLYAVTFIGGPVYDTTGDGTVDDRDAALVSSVAGARATAPFVADRHLVFGAATSVERYGGSGDYNNGISQAGVRVLSWREVR